MTVRRAIVSRASRLASLAAVQGRHAAEQGAFRAMRAWLAKSSKMSSFAQRQHDLLDRALPPASSAAAAAAAAAAQQAQAQPHLLALAPTRRIKPQRPPSWPRWG